MPCSTMLKIILPPGNFHRMKETGGHRKFNLRGRRRRPKQSHELRLTIPQIVKFGTRTCDNRQVADHFMRVPYFILTVFLLHLVLACNDKIETQVEEVTMTETETETAPEPPPPSFSCSNSVTLQEWFFKLCETAKPEKPVVAYKFELFETGNCYAIHLVDSNENDDQDAAGKNDADTSFNYYPLSKNEYDGLEWKQVLDKIKSQIKVFLNTEKFKNSSLAKAKIITMRFDDGDLLRLK